MVNLQKSGDSAVKFVFTDSDHYLYGNGEIEVPVNSLLLVIDESEMVTFKKLSGDPFLSFRADNSNLGTKAAIEQFYKDNMVGSTGGGSESGITSGEVQTMIDNSLEDYYTDDEVDAALSGKASVSDVTAVANDVSTVSGQVATKVATSDFNAYSATTDARIAEDEEVTAAALNNLNENKQDALQYYSESTEYGTADILITNGEGSTEEHHFSIGGGVAEIGIYNEYDDGQGNVTSNNASIYADQIMVTLQAGVTENGDTTSTELMVETTGVTINGENVATESYVDAAITGKVDTSAITTSITSGSTDSEIPTAKAVYDATQSGGGGATYSAGTNISIANDTINCTLNLANGTGNLSLKGGDGCTASGMESFASGYQTIADREGSAAFGKHNVSNSTGSNYFNGSNKNYLFTVGNGDSFSTRHNALEIRQNGDLYFADTDNTTYANYYQKPMVRLQDMYGALGGLKFVQCTQAEYDSMVSGGTIDSSTIYFISNVVS